MSRFHVAPYGHICLVYRGSICLSLAAAISRSADTSHYFALHSLDSTGLEVPKDY